jgi:hypothetical protein
MSPALKRIMVSHTCVAAFQCRPLERVAHERHGEKEWWKHG